SQAGGGAVAQSNIWKDRFRVGAVDVLIPEIGAIGAPLFRDLRVKAGCVEGARRAVGRMANVEYSVHPFTARTDDNHLPAEDRLVNARLPGGLQAVVLDGEAELQTAHGIGRGKYSEVHRFGVVFIDDILHRFVQWRARGTSVTDFCYVMQLQFS